MHAARHEVVARALGRRLGEDRRLDLEEAVVAQEAPRRCISRCRSMRLRCSSARRRSRIAIAQPQLLRRELLALAARDGNRRRLGRPDDAQRRRAHLDVARAELRVSHRRRPRDDLALDEHDRLRAERRGRARELGAAVAGIERHLHDARRDRAGRRRPGRRGRARGAPSRRGEPWRRRRSARSAPQRCVRTVVASAESVIQ